jgi:KilA-N domain
MAGAIVSFFDQFPEYNGQKIEIRGTDGYFCATDMSQVLEKRFTDWRKTQFAQRLLVRLSERLRLPLDWENSPSRTQNILGGRILPGKKQTPLVDYVPGRGEKIWVHPAAAMSYAMSNPEFQADINVWIYELMTSGTVNVHVLKWTTEEIKRGLQYNRDDVDELYGRRDRRRV